MVAFILVGSLTLPSFNGTLKSTLIRTLLPKINLLGYKKMNKGDLSNHQAHHLNQVCLINSFIIDSKWSNGEKFLDFF